MARVSVIIPVYNPGSFLQPAIDSILAQTFQDWEAIVIDDGSTEDISWVANVDPRIRLIRQANQGLTGARNAGILQSTGEFVALLDADDVWLPDKLQWQIRLMDADESLGLSHTQFAFIDTLGEVTEGSYIKSESYIDLLKAGGSLIVSSVLARRSAMYACGLFDPLLLSVQDYDLWLKIARRNRIGMLPNVLTLYRVHQTNMSGNFRVMHRECVAVLRRHALLGVWNKDDNVHHASFEGISVAHYNYGAQAFRSCREHFRKGNYVKGMVDLAYAVRYSPSFVLSSLVRHQLYDKLSKPLRRLSRRTHPASENG